MITGVKDKMYLKNVLKIIDVVNLQGKSKIIKIKRVEINKKFKKINKLFFFCISVLINGLLIKSFEIFANKFWFIITFIINV